MTADNPAARVDLDALRLTGLDYRQIGCACLKVAGEWRHVRLCPVPAVERILADRPAPLLAELRDAREALAMAEADAIEEEDRANENATLVHQARAERDEARAERDALREQVEALAEASIRDGRGGAWVHDEWFAAALADPEAS